MQNTAGALPFFRESPRYSSRADEYELSAVNKAPMGMPEVSALYAPPGAEFPRVPDYWLYKCLRRFSGFVAHFLALGFTIFLVILARPGTKKQASGNLLSSYLCAGLFSWHPVFMAAAYCLCMTEAVLLLSPETSPFCLLSHKSKTRLHWLIQLCVPVFAGVGIAFIICSKNRSEHAHLTSWHSMLGVFTLVATCCQAICGFALLFPRLARVTAVSRLKMYHATCGLVVYLISTSTVLLGMCSDWFQAQIKGPIWYICIALPLYPALVIMNQVLAIYLPRKKGQM